MFVYCNNNPVNMLDENGLASIWYYLKELFKWGFIHSCVQDHIISRNGGISKELWLTKEVRLPEVGFVEIVIGRADLRNNDGAVWEVKHAGQDPASRTALATTQASFYIGAKCTRDGVVINGLGNANAFSGKFVINYVYDGIYESYEVSYDTPSNGVVLYTVKQIKYQETAQYYLANEPAPAPVKKPKEELAFIPIFVPIGLPLGSCPNYYGNFGSGLHNSYFCLR